MNYGFHRVLKPRGVVPQAADVVDSTPRVMHPSELLMYADTLNLDSSSMDNIRGHYSDNIEGRVAEIVRKRGKMHNPDTNSGGVFIGRVKEIGKGYSRKGDLKEGEQIIPLVSLSAIPLGLESIKEIKGDQVDVVGYAVLFDAYPYSKVPSDMGPKLTLSALDISSIVPQMYRIVKPSDTVLVMGCGKAGLTAMSAIRKKCGKAARIIGMDISDYNLNVARELGYAKLAKLDITNQEEFFDRVMNMTEGELCDLVVNTAVCENSETSSILAAKEHGTVYFFNMRTRFDKAALGTDATGKDVTQIIGNGIAEGQAELTLDLLREDKKLMAIYERLYSGLE